MEPNYPSFTWETLPRITFKSMISSVYISEKHIFLSTFSGSIFLVNLFTFRVDFHLNFTNFVEPIEKLTIISDIIEELRGFFATKNAIIYYFDVKYKESSSQILRENSQILIKRLQGEQIIDLLYSPVMEILVTATFREISYFMLKTHHEKFCIEIIKDVKLFETDEEIFQIAINGPKLAISTFKNYYLLNIFSKTLVKIGNKEKQGLFGATFLTINNEELMIAARSQGILWKVDATLGKVLTSLQFVDKSGEKLRYGKLFPLTSELLLSKSPNSIYLLDLHSKTLVMERVFDEKAYNFFDIFAFSGIFARKKAVLSPKVFILAQKNGEIHLESGQIVSLSGLFSKALTKKDHKTLFSLVAQHESLQTLENLRKWAETPGFREILSEKPAFLLVSEIEKRCFSREKPGKLDFFLEVSRKEEPKMIKDRTICENQGYFTTNNRAKVINIQRVPSKDAKTAGFVKKMLNFNGKTLKNREIKSFRRGSCEFIAFFNKKIRKIIDKCETHAFFEEFSQKLSDFLRIPYKKYDFFKDFKEFLDYNDPVLLDFLRTNWTFLGKYQSFYIVIEKIKEILFERSLSFRKNASFFVEAELSEIRDYFEVFYEKITKYQAFKLVGEKESRFLLQVYKILRKDI